jgi:hypothetical protein
MAPSGSGSEPNPSPSRRPTIQCLFGRQEAREATTGADTTQVPPPVSCLPVFLRIAGREQRHAQRGHVLYAVGACAHSVPRVHYLQVCRGREAARVRRPVDGLY